MFRDMRKGIFKEGEVTLRMKMDMQSPNSAMWDPVAYRIKYTAHHRTGDKWCIYPSYDFTHCLNDTLENVTHSLCTLEFVVRRESYNWLVDSLGLYRSVVWEFARLSLTHTLLSKRKLIKLVKEKYVRGWDDPRLSTLVGFRRRGFSPQGINNFCEDLGVTRHNAIIPIERLEEWVRNDLNDTSTRCFAVFDPIKATIRNCAAVVSIIKCPNVPGKTESGEHTVPFSKTIYIERDDFREFDEPEYYGLSLKSEIPKIVKLKYADMDVVLIDIIKDSSGKAVELILECVPNGNAKHAIHWISYEEKPIIAEVRNYDRLFLSEDPIKTHGDNWLSDLNPHSLDIIEVYIDCSCKAFKPYDRIQFERIGFYGVDPDSTDSKLVFNRTLSLKQSSWKKQERKEKK